MPTKHTEVYDFGGFRLDVGEHKITCPEGSKNASLPEKAFRTLVHLVRNPGALVGTDDLLATVWPNVVVEQNNVGKAVHVIRQFLGDTSGEPKFIETVPKHGYRFVAQVTKVGAVEPSNKKPSPVATNVLHVRPLAYDLYIRGKIKAGSENPDDIDDAIEILEAAVTVESLFAEAYAQLARAYNTRAFKFSSASESKSCQENAEVALQKALELSPDLAEAHFARGLILWTKAKRFPHEQAMQSFTRSLELDPKADECHHQLSMVYSHIGLLDEAQKHVRTAVTINPNNTMARFRVGVYTAWQCRFEEALGILKTVPSAVSPMLIERLRAEVLVQLGRFQEAQAAVDEYVSRRPSDEGGSFTSVQALLLAKKGKSHETERMIGRAIKIGKEFGHFHHTAYNIASAYATLNKADDAIKWLEVAADDGFPCFSYFAMDPNLERLRGNRRFTALMATLRRQWERLERIA